MISAIVCVDKNWGIGYKGDLLIKIPEDMAFFKEKTDGETVVMGRKTYDSLSVKPLPNRENVVITREPYKYGEYYDGTYKDKDYVQYANLEQIKTSFKFIQEHPHCMRNEMFVIGGESIYKELLPYCDTVHVTKVNYAFENIDTYFPNLDSISEWEIESESEAKRYNGINYQFYTYKRMIQVDKIKMHEELCKELNETYKNKNHDYGDSFGETFNKLGIVSAVTRISDKYNRLVSLCMLPEEERKVKDESIVDTLLDMANYCIMTVIELEKDKMNK